MGGAGAERARGKGLVIESVIRGPKIEPTRSETAGDQPSGAFIHRKADDFSIRTLFSSGAGNARYDLPSGKRLKLPARATERTGAAHGLGPLSALAESWGGILKFVFSSW
jgi:hypothetical protein